MWVKKSPATENQINQLKNSSGLVFPPAFLEFLASSDGGQFEWNDPELDFVIYSIDEIISANRELKMDEFLPNFFVFGGDRANELLTFKLDIPNKWAVYMTPMIVMSEEDSILLADSFEELLSRSNNDRRR